ncbi:MULTISPECIES: PucR family transcriptional regulator [Pseudonocardia]|uniref:Purine catabolism regulatory protein n=2 Tax=Pseudonocardia TaxID=1847 RepID=A0A1Y2N7M9_PSEAH|nr:MULTISPECIES: helix-turn-helix domain-containing protein [Pseudonocardia]OSY43201.1 Purine catabolism regulatory protein [Pseudonocardia autotrophica]TDN71689.1 PucR-like helix-turn-helix protein [Pseudonocardia autotrophica]BBG02376.1 hypothetical protein Pdca_35850 [Pseudonocardia autotrophica]GEC23288.1 hypothetical protein PSA01_03170 [Pseudonocardia saturnea]
MTRSTTIGRAGGTAPQAWLAGWLRRDPDMVLDSLVAALTSAIPEILVAAEDPDRHVRDAVRVHLDTLSRCFAPDDPDAEIAMPAMVSRYTRALARHEAVPLPVLLRSFETLHAALWKHLVVALRTGDPRPSPAERAAVLEWAAARLFAYFRTASERTASLYGTEQALLERRAASHRADLVAGLLAGTVDPDAAQRELGYDLGTRHVGYVAWTERGSDLDRLDGAVRSLVELIRPQRQLRVPADGRSIRGWLACRGDGWRELAARRALPAGVHIAWGGPATGPAGFRTTHDEARQARRVARRMGATGTVLFDDVAVLALASRDSAAATTFVVRTLGRLVAGGEEADRLLETLRVHLTELGSPTRTARRLHVHPNTVVKRVERIESLLGRPVDPADLALRTATELARLVPGPDPAQVQPWTPPSTGSTTPVR